MMAVPDGTERSRNIIASEPFARSIAADMKNKSFGLEFAFVHFLLPIIAPQKKINQIQIFLFYLKIIL
jgi:hypothetical protein